MKAMLTAAASALALLGAVHAQDRQPPNVVVVLVDDLGFHDLSVNGSDIYQTPAIDALADQSARFVNGYASYPRCTPSRYGLMTSTYPVKENKGNLSKIPAGANFVRVLDDAGYDTHFVGKWHLGDGPNTPVGYGFDTSFAAGRPGGADTHFYPFNTKSAGKSKGDKGPIPDVTEAGEPGDYLTDVLTDEAIRFVGEDRDAPFMVFLSYYNVHTPLEAKPDYEARNRAEIDAHDFGDAPAFVRVGQGREKTRQDHAAYAGMVENTDMNVGRLMDALAAEGLDEDTIVVFTSDHGGLSNDGYKRERDLATTNAPLRAGKGWLYEGGIKVPLYLRWTGTVPPQDEPQVMLGMDVMPTLLDMTLDAELEGVDGVSLETFAMTDAPPTERTVFWHSAKARPYSTGDSAASVVRQGDEKLIHYIESGQMELYDLAEDPYERNDLFMARPDRVKALRARLDAWREAEGASTKVKKRYRTPG